MIVVIIIIILIFYAVPLDLTDVANMGGGLEEGDTL